MLYCYMLYVTVTLLEILEKFFGVKSHFNFRLHQYKINFNLNLIYSLSFLNKN